MQPNWRPGSNRIERNRSRFIAEAVRHKRHGRHRGMALWEWLLVLSRQIPRFAGPDIPANDDHPI
jgi:hypothetical protein